VAEVAIAGGGLIGLACAFRLAARGCDVTVVDPAPLSGASHVAAGMLAPVTELHFGEEPLLALTLAAAAGYGSFVAELEDASGQAVGYRRCGSLTVGLDAGDAAVLTELASYQRSLGLEVETLTGTACRQCEPLLAPQVRTGLLVTGDHQVDNRLLGTALLAACARLGVHMLREPVRSLHLVDGSARGLLLVSGESVFADTVVLAAGPWSAALAPPDVAPPVRPVKGQILRLRTDRPLLGRNVRAVVAGCPVYIVPRASGEIVLGATVEEMGFDTTVRAGAAQALLRDAQAVLPGIAELELVEVAAGLRPGSPDNAPIVGPTGVPGLVVATGHYRNGVLLAPLTAAAVAALIIEGTLPAVMAPFHPGRFTEVAA